MLLHKSIAHDTRVQREAGALAADGHEVTVVYLSPLPQPSPIDLPYRLYAASLRRGRTRLPHAAQLAIEATRLAQVAAATRPDAVHAHDAAMLLPGLVAAQRTGARLVYDSHELATGVPYHSRAWGTLVAAVERLGAPRADAVITVSEGIGERLAKGYRLRRAPAVVRNVCDLPAPGAAPAPDLRSELGIGEAPLILHQGAVAPGRGCETLVRALAHLPEAHLLFLGAEGPYTERLDAIASEHCVGARTHMVGPVAPRALLSHTAQADVGVSLLQDSCENHRLALPNKLFEYIAAGLPVVVSDLPEMAKLVRKWEIGWRADPTDAEEVATALRVALAGREEKGLRRRVASAAAELSWEREKRQLLEVYERLAAPAERSSENSLQ